MLEARLLGKYEVCLNGRLIDVSSRPAQSLLAYLLLSPNQPVRREKLAGLIWPDSSESNARSNLRHALWRVRKSFGSDRDVYLHADDLALSLQLQSDDWVDASILDTHLQDDFSADVLIEIVSAYGGELLPGFYENWVATERERLKTAFEQKMDLLLDRLMAESRWEEAVEWGERWISLGFTPEHAYRAMMIAHAGLGDIGKAATVYQRSLLALERDLGVKPSRQTRKIYQSLMAGTLRDVAPLGKNKVAPHRYRLLEQIDASRFGAAEDILEIYTLGGLRIFARGEPLTSLDTHKVEALLLYVACTAHPQPREVLADLLWEDRSQERAQGNLRVALASLRKYLEAYVDITRDTVALKPGAAVWLDVRELERGLDEVQAGGGVNSGAAARRVEGIFDLYQGDFLEGFSVRDSRSFDHWIVQERERLHHLAISALSSLVEYCLQNGDYQIGIAHATRLLELDPLMEVAHRQMMHLLALSGKRALALKQYETMCEVLDRELRVEPNEKSQQLYEDIRAGRISGDVPQPVASPPSETRPRHNLPPSLTPLVGREGDLENVTALVQDPTCRLVTLVGPGGIGKTRLAIRVADDLLPAFQRGAWFVPLDSLDSSDFIAEAIARALGMPLSGQVRPAEQVLESLRHKETLLVLDNFEHLLPSGTELLIEILHEAPGVQLLVTSREKLNLRAECLFEVRGLAYPQDEGHEAVEVYPAVALFLQLAQRSAGRPLPDEDNRHVARITQLVEGSPLALELAAVWTRALSCREIVEEIEGRLGFLQANQPDVPERHRSMRAVFDHSWRLVSGDAKAAFRRLSVFRGGFDRQAANQVAGASLATLKDLVDKSMVNHHPDGRYRVHTLLRQFAAGELEQAGESAATRERHLAYFLQLAEQAEPQLWREQEKAWLDRLDAELDNLHRAVAWSLSPESALGVHAGLRLVAAIAPFLWRRGHYSEADGWLADLLAHPQAAKFPNAFANCLRLDAFVKYWAMGRVEEAREQFERGLAIAEEHGEPLILAHVLSDFGIFCQDEERNLTDAERYLERSLVLYRDLEYEPGLATVLRRLGHVAYFLRNDYTVASSYYRESLQLWKSLGPSSWIAQGLFELGRSKLWRGDFVKARDLLEESLALFRDLNDDFVEPTVLLVIGRLEFAAGDITRATAYFQEALALARYSGMKIQIARALQRLGWVSHYQGEFSKALSQYDEALALFQIEDTSMVLSWLRLSKGFVFLRQGDRTRAVQLIEQGLLGSRESKDSYLVAIALMSLAGLSASGAGQRRAARLWGAAEALLESSVQTLSVFPARHAEYKRIKAQVQQQLDEATFKQLVHEGRAMAAEGLDHLVEYALEEIGGGRVLT